MLMYLSVSSLYSHQLLTTLIKCQGVDIKRPFLYGLDILAVKTRGQLHQRLGSRKTILCLLTDDRGVDKKYHPLSIDRWQRSWQGKPPLFHRQMTEEYMYIRKTILFSLTDDRGLDKTFLCLSDQLHVVIDTVIRLHKSRKPKLKVNLYLDYCLRHKIILN